MNMPKPRLQLLTLPPKGDLGSEALAAPTAGYSCTRYGLPHLEQHLLDDIVQQVHAEGYCAAHLSVFAAENMAESDTIDAIYRWAKQTGLSVGFSVSQDICVFELG